MNRRIFLLASSASALAQLPSEKVNMGLIGAGVALTGQASAFSAEFAEDTRYMAWSVADIQKFRDGNPELAVKFNDLVNRYLVAQINKLALHLSDAQEGSA